MSWPWSSKSEDSSSFSSSITTGSSSSYSSSTQTSEDGCQYTTVQEQKCHLTDGGRQCESFKRFFRQCPGKPLEEKVMRSGDSSDQAGTWVPADKDAKKFAGGGGGIIDGLSLGRSLFGTLEDLPFGGSFFDLRSLLGHDNAPSQPPPQRRHGLWGERPWGSDSGSKTEGGSDSGPSSGELDELARFAERYQRRLGGRNQA